MPIPEPAIRRLSHLTAAQKQAQLAACYGVPMQPQQLNESEIQQMRQILAQHDSERKPMSVFDLNNPPRAAYRFEKFPMMVYDLENSFAAYEEDRPARNGMGVESVHVPAKVVSRMVSSEQELEQALGEGFVEQAPNFSEIPEEALNPKYAREAAGIDAKLEALRPKRGRREQHA